MIKIKRPQFVQLFRDLLKKIFRLFLRWQARHQLPKTRLDPQSVRRILIFSYMGIGDMLMFTPTLKLLRQKFPAAKITLQTGLRNSCEQVIVNSNLIDETREIELDLNIFKFMRYGKSLAHQFDLLISEFHNPYYELAFQTLYMKIPARIGHVSSPGYPNPFDFLYNFPVEMRENQHTISRSLSLLKPLGIKADFAKEKFNTEIFLAESDLAFAETYWQDHQLSRKTVIGIQTGTASYAPWKQWPIENFIKLIQMLIDQNQTLLLFGSPSERAMIEQIAAGVSGKPIVVAGTTTFLQSCALIAKCQQMITNDSGLMHVANALNVPLLAIYGPTDYRRTAPLARTSRIIRLGLDCSPCFRLQGDAAVLKCPYQYRCLRELTPDMVLEALQLLTKSA